LRIAGLAGNVPLVPRVAYSTPEGVFALPGELVELRELAREIVNAECIPLESKFLSANPDWETPPQGGESSVDGRLPAEDWQRLLQVSRESGIWSATLPEEYGGLGYGILGAFVLAEERNRSIVPLPTALVFNMLYSGSEQQKERYLVPMMEGRKRACYAQTEPFTGSDPGSMQTRAVRDGDEWVINGSKTFISLAGNADFHLLLAVTDEEKRSHGGITMFIVDADLPGIQVTPLRTWITPREPHQFSIFYEDVRVPHEAILGQVGGGFALGQQFLAIQDRLTRGSLATGFLTRGLEIAVAWAQNRVSFGRPLSDRQAIQNLLVDVFVDLKAIRALSYECAARADRGEDVRASAAMAKLVGGNWGHRSMDKLMQVLGGAGEVLDSPIPHWYHVIRHGRIGGGTDEIQRMLISRAIFKEGRSLWEA
jgi:acyl-CoA dehydrogenase